LDKKIYDDAVKEVIRGLPFYSYIFARTKKIYDDKFKAMAGMSVDKTTARPVMILNKKMMEENMKKMEINESEAPKFIAAIIQHELDHYILGHVFIDPKSVYGKYHVLHNIAADSSINRYIDMLQRRSFTPEDYFEQNIPEGGVFFSGSRELSDFTAESMFNHLLRYMTDENQSAEEIMSAGSGNRQGEGKDGEGDEEGDESGSGIRGDLDSHDGFGVPGDIKEAAQSFRDSVIKESYEKSKGEIPGHLQETINEILRGKVNWKQVLKRFSGKGVLGRMVETIMRQNRRFDDQPGRRIDEEGKIGVILDTSGSMSDKELKKAFSEIDNLTNRQRKFYIIQYDAEVTGVEKYRRGAWKRIKVKGRGGTDMRPALEKAMEMRIRRIVSITDGYDYFNTELLKNFKVLFLLTKDHCSSFKQEAEKNGFKTIVMED